MKKPKISAVMAVYNKEKFLRQAIESTLNQTYTDFEFIIVNDASTDESDKICREYAGKYKQKIKYINIEKNGGAGNSFEIGTRASSGEYITFIASDDIQHKDKFKTCVDILDNEKNIDMLFSNYITIDIDGSITGRRLTWPDNINNDNEIFDIELRRNYMFSGLCFMRNGDFVKFDTSLKYSEDYDMFLSLTYQGKRSKFIDNQFLFYRMHDNNISSNYGKTDDAVRYILNKYSYDGIELRLRKDGVDEKRVYNTLGMVCMIKSDYEKAVEFLIKASNIEAKTVDDLADSIFYLANAKYFIGNIEEAEKCLNKYLEVNKSEPAFYNNMGVIKYAMRDMKAAETMFNKALELEPLYFDAKENLKNVSDGVYSKEQLQKMRYTKKYLRKNVVHTNITQ